MAVTCKKCGGSHPVWECTASAAKIAAYAESQKSAVERFGQKPGMVGVKSTEAQKDEAVDNFIRGRSSAVERGPSKSNVAGSIPAARSNRHAPEAIPVLPGTKFIAEVPPGTKLMSYGNRVIAAGPDLQPSIVTSNGLVPLTVPVTELKKGGRPRTVENRKVYKADKERERRAKRAQREGKSE